MTNVAIEIVKPSVTLLTPTSWFDDMVSLAEYCGRLCHKSEDKTGVTSESTERFLRKWCIEGKDETTQHSSILEHAAQISFHFIGSRTMSHQLVRHRIGLAISQESQRYCDYSHTKYGNVLKVICPPSIAEVPSGLVVRAGDSAGAELAVDIPAGWTTAGLFSSSSLFPDWAAGILRAYAGYLSLRSRKVPAEDARFSLPNAAKTELVVTANARAWRHIFTLRCDSHAQWELRALATTALHILADRMPSLFADMAAKFPLEPTRI